MNYMEEYLQRMLFLMDFKAVNCVRGDMPICHITKGYFDYKNLNMCFVNDMVARIAECLYRGYLPIVEVPGGDGLENLWGAFFKQPHEILGIDYHHIENRVDHFYEMEPVWGPGYKANLIPRELVCATNLYQELVKPNDDTQEYIEKEQQEIIGGKELLGVLVRGTDLGDAHPANHPVQPSMEQVLADIEAELSRTEYDGIYLASDDASVEELLKERFPDELILINRRHYISEYYEEAKEKQNNTVLTDVMVDNRLDLYSYGIEYLSSLFLLSNCKSLIAGNTLGSSAALFLNGRKYDNYLLYDLGFYGE